MRRVPLILVVLAAVIVAAGAGAPDAHAVEPPPPGTWRPGVDPPPSWWWSQLSKQQRLDWIARIRAASVAQTGTTQLALLESAQYGGRLTRILWLVGRSPAPPLVIGVASVGLLAWQIHENFFGGGGSRDYYVLAEPGYFGGTAVMNPGGTNWTRTAGQWQYTALPITTADGTWPAGYYFVQQITVTHGGGTVGAFHNAFILPKQSVLQGECMTADATACYDFQGPGIDTGALERAGAAGTGTLVALDGVATPLRADEFAYAQLAGTSCLHSQTTSGNYECHAAHVPLGDMSRLGTFVRDDELPAGATIVGTETRTEPDLTTTLANDLDTAIQNEACTRAAFNHAIAPEAYPWNGCETAPDGAVASEDPTPTDEHFVLPRPEQTESWPEYVTRLRNLGWLGSYTITTLAPGEEEPLLGPSGVVAIRVQTGQLVRTVYWPTQAPEVGYEDDLTLWANPVTGLDGEPLPDPTDPLPDPSDDPTPTDPPPPPSEEPGFEPPGSPPGVGLDFSPITDIDWGCAFPFGFINCYAIGFTEYFDVAPDAPSWSFDWNSTANPSGGTVGGTVDYEIDLDFLDPYMEIWRTLLSVVLWVGGVYFVATRLLGFNAGGDPAGALDDVM